MSKLPNVTVYKRDDIIKLINGISPVEECMIRDIITEYDKEMGEAIVDNKIVSVPYIGKFKKNQTKIEFNKKKHLLKIAKRYMSREDLKEYAKECYIEARKIAENKDRLRKIIRENIINNRKKYERLILKCGKSYADMFILSITLLNPVQFNQDVEDAWQEIWRLEDET